MIRVAYGENDYSNIGFVGKIIVELHLIFWEY